MPILSNARLNTRLAVLSLVMLTAPGARCILAQAAPQSPFVASAPDPVAVRFANELLQKMTLEEKIGQMSQTAMNTTDRADIEEGIRSGRIGSLLFITDPVEINRLQKIAVEESRLHIPLIVGFDVIHGFRTIYPVPLAMASSWDPAVAEHAQSMAAREASAAGVRWAFAPMVDIARDPRWGRIMEGAGEDPYLGARMAEAQVRGFQGADPNVDLADPHHILACVKHFAGYGAALGGRDYDSANISDDQLWNVHLPPFKAAVDAGAGSIMSAYMDLNSVPATGNRFLLHDVLREQWHFQGFVVSDWDAVQSLTVHGFSANAQDAAVRAVNAGVDMEMTSHTFRDQLPSALKAGDVSIATIDNAVRDILIAKYHLGLFRHPYVDVALAAAEQDSPAQRAAARAAAQKTAVLLRNEGHLLPLRNPPASMAVIGPLADTKIDTLGSWSLASHPADTVTVLEGLQRKFAQTKISSTTGVEIERVQPSIFDAQFASAKPKLHTDAERKAEFEHALQLVRDSDMTVMVLGELQNMSGERASRSSLTLPGQQEELLEAVVATGKPVVLVLLNGRPLNITWASQHVAAILEAWYPGTEGGDAVADLLAGTANPGGKLPVTWPRSVGQIPIYYGDNLTQIPESPDTRYWDGSSAPLYPFGYGLSYSEFKLDQLRTSTSELQPGGSMQVSVDVQNTTDTPGDEVVQIYTHQRAGSASRPVRELKGFRRVHLEAHEKQMVTIPLSADALSYWSPASHTQVTEPGEFDLWAGDSSAASLHTTFRMVR
jgi:beta-glucosidase